ncbi:MAG: 1-deoxy-D-xylulose-5-phosphate reductoisomerase [Candidatus Eisenbacteria sp.]|nr:1-deoxy-D-xylulose-5-phosphate reductoisomerase [Candidatus Eisenbacteria bacterium]
MQLTGRERTGLVVLGSTGTIGRLVLEIASRHRDRIRVIGLSAGANASLLASQAATFGPEVVVLADPAGAAAFERQVSGRWRGDFICGDQGLQRLAAWRGADVVINGIVGAAGLRPSLAALQAGRRLGLANKESLVMAGGLVKRALREFGGELIPVDSEHSAIFQCLAGRDPAAVRRIVLTASGGPFRGLAPDALARVTPAEALRHPTWQMGPRITVDSATLFNKGMELIEACWLFDLPLERVDVLIHPQSIVHGLVETTDGSLIAQLSAPDMRLPIQLAISHPERWGASGAYCDLAAMGSLTFETPDEDRFPCLGLARMAFQSGGTAPAVANAADEILVKGFLAGRIPFHGIADGLRAVLKGHAVVAEPSLEQILEADAWARGQAKAFVIEKGAMGPLAGGGERGAGRSI